MWLIGVLAGLALIVVVLVDCFEAMLLPRRVTHRYRYARLYYLSTWKLWRGLAMGIRVGNLREAFLSTFGPLSLLGLFTTWLIGLILGFALLHWSLDTVAHAANSPNDPVSFATDLYLSGVTIFTLGYGEVVPITQFGRFLAVAESGLGFGFLAVVISYLPVLYQAFSRRELTISLLDARAGSPPTAAQFLLRLARSCKLAAAEPFLAEWESWCAEVLESHLSFPVLSYYRSQHDNQSWLSALTAILDTCALLIIGIKDHNPYQAKLTFAMARHTVVDLALVLKTPPLAPDAERLPSIRLQELRRGLRAAGHEMAEGDSVDAKLAELRGMYEPFIAALARHFLITLPEIVPEAEVADNWQRSAWMQRTPGIGSLPRAGDGEDHFG